MKQIMITVGGKAYPCHLTMGAILLFKRNMGKEVTQMEQGNLEELLMLMWCCVASASRAEGLEIDMDFEAFCDRITMEDVAKWNASLQVQDNEQKKTEP